MSALRCFVVLLCLTLRFDCSLCERARKPPSAYKMTRTLAEAEFNRSMFSPCKGSRVLNPGESVQANVIATRILQRLGTKELIRIGTAYNMPAYVIYRLADMACLEFLIIFSYYSEEGDCVIPRSITQGDMSKIVYDISKALRSRNRRVRIRHRNDVFELTWENWFDLMDICAKKILSPLDGKVVSDCNQLIHAISYIRKLLL